MGFWESFKDGYRAARDGEVEVPFAPADETFDRQPGYDGRLEELEAALRARDEELAESKGLVADLAAEMQKLTEELKVRRRAEPRGAGEEKYKKLRRAVIRLVHPDAAAGNTAVRAVLQRICQELNAEMDRINSA